MITLLGSDSLRGKQVLAGLESGSMARPCQPRNQQVGCRQETPVFHLGCTRHGHPVSNGHPSSLLLPSFTHIPAPAS